MPEEAQNSSFGDTFRALISHRQFAEAAKLIEQAPPESLATLRDWRDDNGNTALHWSVLANLPELTLFMLDDVKIPVDSPGINKQTPLMWAAEEEHLLMLNILWDYKADINARDDLNDNIVTLASQHEKFLAVLWALSKGANIDAANIMGTTAAHWAAFSAAYMILSALEAFGADLETTYDHAGLLPLHRALQLDYFLTARMLAQLRPSQLTILTKEGLDLHAFAAQKEISKTEMDKFFALTKDPDMPLRVKPFLLIAKSDQLEHNGTALKAGLKSSWLHLGFYVLSQALRVRSILWDLMADCLMKMESTGLGRRIIPAIAMLFAAVFVLVWNMELSAVSVWLRLQICSLLLNSSMAGAMNWLLRLPPLMGMIGIVLFHVLLVLDPGTIPKSKDRRLTFKPMQDRTNNIEFLCAWEKLEVDPERHKRLSHWLHGKGVKVEDLYPDSDTLARSGRQKEAASLLDATRICPTCWIWKDLRSKHCSLCNCCCEVMDHHCLWLNKCVGRNNHRLFVTFVLLSLTAQIHQSVVLLIDIVLWLAHGVGVIVYPVEQPGGWHGWLKLLIMLVAGGIHFVTHRWGMQLVWAQMISIWEGVTVNESLSMARYSHFLCKVPYTHTAEKLQAIEEALEDDEAVTTERIVKERHFVDVDGAGKELVSPRQGSESETWIRQFSRNPFTLNKSGWRNCWNFWLGKVPVQVDWIALERFDVSFRTETIRKLHEREQRLLRQSKEKAE